MIIIENNFDLLDIDDNKKLQELCDGFVISETPKEGPDGGKNYYNRFFISKNAPNLKDIFAKIVLRTKSSVKKTGTIPCDILLQNTIWLNKVDFDSNKNDNFHYDMCDITTILYLNDDFEGGEFEYIDENNKKIKINPKKNMMIISSNKLSHRVLPVTSGIRYSLICPFDFVIKDKKTLL